MPEPTPSPFAGGTTERPPRSLTPEAIETVLADFRSWLEDTAASPSTDGVSPGEPPIDLHAVLSQFVALRHEVNLQTKASRGQQEQNAEALRQLSQALEALRQKPDDQDVLRPFLKGLLDVADALSLARREIERLQSTVTTSLDQLRSALPERRSFLERWFGNGSDRRAENAREAADRARQLLDSVLTGYRMSLQRVERVLQQQGLEPIPAVGQPFDPERMEVVEAVTASGKPSGEVLAEVRRGYRWNGRVFRYAQVSVAK